MNNTASDQEPVKSEKDVPILSTTNDGITITEAEFSKLTFRQKFALTEYEYLLSPEGAEQVGRMLRNLAKEKDVLAFCQAYGAKAYADKTLERSSNTGVGGIVVGFFGWVVFHNVYFLISFVLVDLFRSNTGFILFLVLPFLVGLLVLILTKKVWIGVGSIVAIVASTVVWISDGLPILMAFLLPFPLGAFIFMD